MELLDGKFNKSSVKLVGSKTVFGVEGVAILGVLVGVALTLELIRFLVRIDGVGVDLDDRDVLGDGV